MPAALISMEGGRAVMLFPYQRLAELYETIQAETLPQDELAMRFQVSARTIRTDIGILNDALQDYGAHIHYERGTGYRLIVDDQRAFAALPQTAGRKKIIPRSSKDRIHLLLLRFLTQAAPVKLDLIADEWCVSRGTVHRDMNEVKDALKKYQLALETRPWSGSRVSGTEPAIRNAIADVIWQMSVAANKPLMTMAVQEFLMNIDLHHLAKILQNSVDRFDIKLSHDALHYLSMVCAVSIVRITSGHEIIHLTACDNDPVIDKASQDIAQGLSFFLGSEYSAAELAWLQIQIAARRVIGSADELKTEINSAELVDNMLNFIHGTYNYDLRHDRQLRDDLTTHLVAMLTRVKYQVSTPNPLLADIKTYYPFAWDVTLSALSKMASCVPYTVNEDEAGYLAVHIGVGLERNYSSGFERHPRVIIVSDSGISVLRMIEEKLLRQFPQIVVERVIALRDYEQLPHVEEDFIISTLRLTQKNKPVVRIALFPTPWQIEQIGRLVMVDRTRPWIFARFFNERRFMRINGPMTQGALFKRACNLLKEQGFTADDFYPSLLERESIMSTLLGDGIAIPHALGLRAKKTAVVTILAPDGVAWSNKDEVAQVIFLLAISKEDSDEAVRIYDLFMTFIREKATRRLVNSASFDDFQAIATDCFGRSA